MTGGCSHDRDAAFIESIAKVLREIDIYQNVHQAIPRHLLNCDGEPSGTAHPRLFMCKEVVEVELLLHIAVHVDTK